MGLVFDLQLFGGGVERGHIRRLLLGVQVSVPLVFPGPELSVAPGGTPVAPSDRIVITSYSIHYTKLYEFFWIKTLTYSTITGYSRWGMVHFAVISGSTTRSF